MANTSLDIRQSQTRTLQDQLNANAVTQMDSTLASINSELTMPGRLIAASTPSLVVTVGAGTVVNPNTGKNRSLPLINNVSVAGFTGGTITFPSASGGGTITPSPGNTATISIGASQFCAVLVQLDSTGNLNLTVGVAASSLGAVVVPGGSTSFLSLGFIIVQSNASSVIQSITNSMLYQFSGGGGAGGSGSGGLGDDLASLQFRADILDAFSESPAISTSTIDNTTAKTNASFSSSKNMYAISYDAAKTATSTGTTVTMSAAPAYTVVAGDVIYNQSTGEVKKITVVSSQTSYTIESAFAANLATSAVTVSQAVHTKDVYNFAVDSNGDTIASAFSASPTFSEIAVFYKDNSTAGSNQWAINTAANVAFVGSPDGSTWTIAQKRATNVTDQYQSTVFSAAGSSLYLRFFAVKTSGSGTVNLLMYKAYMQKSVASPSGGVQFAAYGTTNNSTTPVGCTIATSGGKTQITLTGGNQYAVGVNSGQTYGACDVYLNGQLLPRFVSGTVPSTDSYFTEVSGTVIQLDKDYSSLQLEVQILVRAQVIDASTTNTTNLAGLNAVMGTGLQSYVDTTTNLIAATTTAGSPTGGTFYSSITNRASIPDLSQDLKPRFGIERFVTEQLYPSQAEFGPSGQIVWTTPNDTFGQIRFVGASWGSVLQINSELTSGNRVQATNVGDYCEVTFYGTGLNMLIEGGSSSDNITAQVDGGTAGSNFMPSNPSTILTARNYASNGILQVVSGLALGIHTVTMTLNAGAFRMFGFEVINQNATASNVSVNPGIGYANGLKISAAAQALFAYNSVVTGTRGGRVLVYETAAGAIAQAFQATNASSAFLASVSHANEEAYRVYWPREFGASRSDDWSLLTGSTRAASFTLDDGTTTLVGDSVQDSDRGGFGFEGISPSLTSNYFTLTFVGTGLDIVAANFNSPQSYTVTVDGTSVGTIAFVTAGVLQTRTIASGLPYGTHTVKFIPSSANGGMQLTKFIAYQPKKPTLPAGAVELGDYNVFANYVANTTSGSEFIATGVLRKSSIREWLYIGSGLTTQALIGQGNAGSVSGWQVSSNGTAGNGGQYTFFGTGFELRMSLPQSATSQYALTVDGSSNLSSFTTSQYGFTSFTASTGVIVAPTASSGSSGGMGVTVSGLALGLHTVKILHTSGSNMNIEALDIITPIYSSKLNLSSDFQNTLPVGSTAISDNRKTSPVKSESRVKGFARAYAITNNPTCTTLVPCPEMSVTLNMSQDGMAQIAFNLDASGGSAGFYGAIFVDGVQVSQPYVSASTGENTICIFMNFPLSKGAHKIDGYFSPNSSGTVTATSTRRYIEAREV